MKTMKVQLKRSYEENKPVEMIYLAANNIITHRKIIVKELHGSYIKAFCFLRKDNRLFKIENILSVMPVREKHLKTS
jgi:predicted DNA-binding transcriptional regulator YafY